MGGPFLGLRTRFLEGVARWRAKGQLRLAGKYAASASGDPLAALLAELRERPWVVYIEAPPHENASPQHVLKYLARYLTGGPILDQRLISQMAGNVTFRARGGEKPLEGCAARQVPVTLSGIEFTRRWSLHILPKGFTKARRYGGYSNRRRKSYLRRCRELLGASSQPTAQPIPEAEADPESAPSCCPRCGVPLTCVGDTGRPDWSRVMDSPHRPLWYRDG